MSWLAYAPQYYPGSTCIGDRRKQIDHLECVSNDTVSIGSERELKEIENPKTISDKKIWKIQAMRK